MSLLLIKKKKKKKYWLETTSLQVHDCKVFTFLQLQKISRMSGKQESCKLVCLLTDESTKSQEELKGIQEKLTHLAKEGAKFSNAWLHSTKPMIKQLSSLDCDESGLKQDLRQCATKLKTAQTGANLFIKRLNNFFALAASDNDMIKNIKDSFQRRDTTIFQSYISQLRMVIENCREYYTKFEEKKKDAEEFCAKTSRSIEAKFSAAKDKKDTANGVAAATGLVGAAVVGGLIAGFFTLGVCTVAGAVAAASITGGATYLGHEYGKVQEIFKGFRSKMDDFNMDAASMSSSLEEVEKLLLTSTEESMNDADRTCIADDKGGKAFAVNFCYFNKALDLFADGARSARDFLLGCFKKEED